MAGKTGTHGFATSISARPFIRARHAALVAVLALGLGACVPPSPPGSGPGGLDSGDALADEPRPRCSVEDPAAGVGSQSGARHPAPVVRAATYNLLFAQGTSVASLDARLPLIVDALVSADVDVVGVQEVEVLASRGETTARVAAGLAEATGQRWHWCWFLANPVSPDEPDTHVGGGGPIADQLAVITGGFMGEDEWRTGEGIVSRYPIVDSGAHRLPGRVQSEIDACGDDPGCVFERSFESRVAIRAVVDTPTGPFHVFSTHLAHTLTAASEETRLGQVEGLLAWADDVVRSRPVPGVLVGDFNTREGSPVHQAVLDAGFVDTFRVAHPDGEGFTSPQSITAAEPTVRNRIDYVFARGQSCTKHSHTWWALAPSVRASSILGDEPGIVDGAPLWPSDHYGVVSELRTLPNRTFAGCARARLER